MALCGRLNSQGTLINVGAFSVDLCPLVYGNLKLLDGFNDGNLAFAVVPKNCRHFLGFFLLFSACTSLSKCVLLTGHKLLPPVLLVPVRLQWLACSRYVNFRVPFGDSMLLQGFASLNMTWNLTPLGSKLNAFFAHWVTNPLKEFQSIFTAYTMWLPYRIVRKQCTAIAHVP